MKNLNKASMNQQRSLLFTDRYLTLWIFLAMFVGPLIEVPALILLVQAAFYIKKKYFKDGSAEV